MQKIIRIDNKVIVMFENGSYYEKDNISEDIFNKIISAETEEEILKIVNPQYEEQVAEYEDKVALKDSIENSNLLTLKGNSVYWEDVSPLSVPTELASAIVKAEVNKDENLITTYKNFWTLMSLNPNEECRQNLFWFLTKWGLKLSKCGFFVAYRNAVWVKKEEDGSDIYTDAYSGTTRIKIGEVVTMPREKCDTDSSHSCSRGLHGGGAGWLKRNYMGNSGLVILINPADVTAVPYIEDYGKLRTCAYLPIAKVEFNDDGDVIPINLEDGFDCSYVTKVIYEGIMGTEEDSTYRINIPEIPGINRESISDKLLDIAMKCITNKQV